MAQIAQGEHVTVLGCGVIGLTAAVLLQSRGYRVCIVSKSSPDGKVFTGDLYAEDASREAGAYWSSVAEEHDHKLKNYEKTTFLALLQLSKLPQTGVMLVDNKCLFKSNKPDGWQGPWYQDIVPKFRLLDQSELPAGFQYGYMYQTVTISPPVYLRWLLTYFRSMGGTLQTQYVSHIEELLPCKVVVNCTGLGSKALGGVQDGGMYPVRGQTVLIRAPEIKCAVTMPASNSENISYVIPRIDGTVLLGGTYEVYNANTTPDKQCAQSIIDKCCAICPELDVIFKTNGLQILRHSCGLRPFRVGGLRVESEMVGCEDSAQMLVVHCYGHGPGGYQSSFGTCAEAVKLVDAHFSTLLDRSVAKL